MPTALFYGGIMRRSTFLPVPLIMLLFFLFACSDTSDFVHVIRKLFCYPGLYITELKSVIKNLAPLPLHFFVALIAEPWPIYYLEL
jgi:hypothetical protein